MINISSAMGAQFAQAAQAFSKTIIELGPNPLREPSPMVPKQNQE
jgi:coenzyme F420-reducing hydrogenase delta subunit